MKRDPSYLDAIQGAEVRKDAGVKEFRATILAAHKNGWSVREIAGRIGLSPTRVHQILKQRA